MGKKNIYLFTLLQTLSKKFRTLGKESSRLIKTEFNGSRRVFWGFFEKKTFKSLVSHFEHKTNRVAGNAIWMSRRTFWGQTIFGKNICPSWSFLDFESLIYQNFDENTSVRLSSLHSTCPGEESEWKHFSRKNYIFFPLSNF